jgi:phosphoadenosine phosphosulfate reductase
MTQPAALSDEELIREGESLEAAPPERILAWAVERFGGRIALSCSFGGDGGIVLAHMVSTLDPRIPILFLDTGLLFDETIAFRRNLASQLALDVIDVHPAHTVDEQAAALGPQLWERDPDRCCHERKVLPMITALAPYDGWITGIRRGQTANRDGAPIIARDHQYGVVKICPLANFGDGMISDYMRHHGLPGHPLRDHGYPSIGCLPCTSRVAPGEDPRSGRWRGQDKSECGLHHLIITHKEGQREAS